VARLALLQDAVGGKTSFAVLMNPDTPFSALALKEIQAAAETRRVQIVTLKARTAEDVTRQLAEVGPDIGGLLVLGDTLTLAVRGPIADLALKKRLPTASQSREFVDAGGLFSYGPDRRPREMKSPCLRRHL
jgi:putative ABC transport system substrate-binding protein